MSAKESSCSPSADATFSFLAKNPSKKSKKIPNKTKKAAIVNAPSTAKITAIVPENKLRSVMRLGIRAFKRIKFI